LRLSITDHGDTGSLYDEEINIMTKWITLLFTSVTKIQCLALVLMCLIPATASAQTSPAPLSDKAQGTVMGAVTGLPLPRYASLKTDRVNLREGPSKDHRTLWVYQREGLPVEIISEFETWRRIRDAEGTEGWVLHSLLSGRRSGLVAPWNKPEKAETLSLYERADEKAGLVAKLQPNVMAHIKTCNGSWCRILGKGFDGYIRQERLWGVYPNERIE
jgi:SH3-like domain-containing protein